ncbi:MAG: hypothetical protein QMB16_03915 [Paracoccaceae bacterium]
MLIITLKFFHFIAIFTAGGIGIGGAIVQSALAKAGESPSSQIRRALSLLSIIGLISIVTLWITGIGLVYAIYGELAIKPAFGVKLIGASLVLATSVLTNLHMAKSVRTKHPPNRGYLKPLIMLGRLGLVLALAGVAVAFS